MRRGQKGFTLLEAIVAMALLALIGGALLAWLDNGFRSLERIGALHARIEVQRNVLAHMRQVNPMLQPNGEMELGPYRLSWKSTELTSPRAVLSRYGQTMGPFDAALYRVRVVITAEGLPEQVLSFEQVGYRQVRSAEEGGQ